MSLHYADAMRTWGSEESALISARAPHERFHSQASLQSNQFGSVPVLDVLDASRPTASPSQSQQIMADNLFTSFGPHAPSREVYGIPEESCPEGPRLSMGSVGQPELQRLPPAQYFGGPPTDPRLIAPGSIHRMNSMGSQGQLYAGPLQSERIVVDAGRPPEMQGTGTPPLGYRMEGSFSDLYPPTSERGIVDAAPGSRSGLDSSFMRSSSGVAAFPSSGSVPTPPMTSAGYPRYGTAAAPGAGMGMLDRGSHFATPPRSPETAAVLDAGCGAAGYGNDPLQDSVWSFSNEVQDQSADGLNAELMASVGLGTVPIIKEESGPEKPQRRSPPYQAAFDMECEIAQLEGVYLQQREDHLHNQLSILESIAKNIVTIPEALDDWDPEQEAIWRAGTREWRSTYTLDSLNGFWIDKTQIAKREEHLWKVRSQAKDNFVFEWIAGVPVEAKNKRKAELAKMTWRSQNAFNEVDDDDFAYINREQGGDCAGRVVRPETAQVLTF